LDPFFGHFADGSSRGSNSEDSPDDEIMTETVEDPKHVQEDDTADVAFDVRIESPEDEPGTFIIVLCCPWYVNAENKDMC
jgi:hypothetical protein